MKLTFARILTTSAVFRQRFHGFFQKSRVQKMTKKIRKQYATEKREESRMRILFYYERRKFGRMQGHSLLIFKQVPAYLKE